MDEDGAAEAIKSLDGQDFQGRDLRVNEAKPREDRGGRGGGRGGFNRGGGNRGGNRGGDRGGDRGYGSSNRW